MEYLEYEKLKSRMYALRDVAVNIQAESDDYTTTSLLKMRIKAINDCIEIVTDHQIKITEQQQLIGETQ